MSIPHMPTRPAWVCSDCPPRTKTTGGATVRVDWPCDPAKVRILGDFDDGVALNLYLADHFAQAAEDLQLSELVGLHNRFFGWAHTRDRA